MKKARTALFPPPAFMSQAEAILRLKRQVFDDAVAAGWLAPCSRKKSSKGKDSIFYALAAVQDVELRIVGGEYPGQEEGRAA